MLFFPLNSQSKPHRQEREGGYGRARSRGGLAVRGGSSLRARHPAVRWARAAGRHTRGQRRAMNEDTFGRSRFAVVMRGYDRDQVDAILEACERWAREAQAHMDGTEVRLTETDRRAEALEDRLSELESRGDAKPPQSLQTLTERTEQLLGIAREAADELQTGVEAEARADKEQSERAAAQLREAAQARAGEIAAAAKRHQQDAAKPAHEARQLAARHIEEGRAAAVERA